MSEALDANTGMSRQELDLHFSAINRSLEDERAARIEDMKLLRNGAQASLNTSAQLNGIPEFGVPGFIPETNRRLTELENIRKQEAEENKARREIDDKRFAKIEDRLDFFKRIADRFERVFQFMGKIADWKVWLLGAIAFILYFFPTLRNHPLVTGFEHLLRGGK